MRDNLISNLEYAESTDNNKSTKSTKIRTGEGTPGEAATPGAAAAICSCTGVVEGPEDRRFGAVAASDSDFRYTQTTQARVRYDRI